MDKILLISIILPVCEFHFSPNHFFVPSDILLLLSFVCYRFQPGVEDKEMYKKYKGDKTALQSTDQFLIKV